MGSREVVCESEMCIISEKYREHIFSTIRPIF
jgi:hypothetical protein